MANTLTGKIIAISDVEKVASSEQGKEPFKKRKLFMDCTRYDPYTGERGFENTPLLEFGGKPLEDLEALMQQGLKKDDVVVVSFDIQGTKYKNKTTGKQEIFTRVRPYKIELFKQKDQAPEPVAPAPAPAPQPQPSQGDLPF